MNRETEEEVGADQRARLARLACGEGEAAADGDLVRAAALRGERLALLKRLAKTQPELTKANQNRRSF